MTFDRHTLTLLLAAVIVTTATDAGATAVCDRLRDRLARTPVVIGASSEIRKHSSAIARQNFEIRKVRHDLRQMGCGNGSIITYGTSEQNICVELSEALTRMETNKQTLMEKRRAIGSGNADSNPTRQRILAAIDANGCNELPMSDPEQEPSEASTPPGLIRQPDSEGNAFDALADQLSQDYPANGGNLRTLCVRTCDGSFFPISANATPLNFRRDAQVCQQMCPGTETELYYHSILTEESADMVSTSTGRPYRELPTAFSYLSRPTGDKPACGCNISADRNKSLPNNQGGQTPAAGGYSSITEIKSKPEAGTTPPAPAEMPERSYDPAESKVRRVGPMFLPTETSSIDLKNPALPGPQPVQQ